MRVTSEVHGIEVVDGADDGLKKRGDELARGGEGMKVGPREELGEDVVVKDVGKGSQGEVVFDDEVGVANSENGEGGAVQEIRGEGRGKGEKEVNWESSDTVERKAVRLLIFGEGGVYGKIKNA